MTLADKILQFNRNLSLGDIQLPEGIRVMNPFREGDSEQIAHITGRFYQKLYADNQPRRMILGINPGRFGAGVTGIPFTDTKRLEQYFGWPLEGIHTHEMSSVFIYELIEAYGGVEAFYSDFYITSLSPLGFVITNEKGREVNYNFYDRKDLENAVKPFIIKTLQEQIAFGMHTDRAFVLGTGKNFKFFQKLNQERGFFQELIPLEHPRYVMQYKLKHKADYLEKFCRLLQGF